MSQKIRVGNDIAIRWSLIDAEGDPYDLENRNVSIEIIVAEKKRVRIREIETTGNTVSFVYYGKDQKYTGRCDLKFIENDGDVEMVTFDTKDAFTLVPHSWLAVDEGETPETIQLEFVTVTSELVEKIGPPGFSPIATVEKVDDTATITITDKNGTTTAEVKDGSDATVTREKVVEVLGGVPVMTETDPTVPAWAKSATKPTYTAEEVGALPADTELKDLPADSDHRTVTDAEKAAWSGKQDTLVSGTNIKTINGESILGSGDIEIESGDEAVWGNISGTLADQTDLANALGAKYEKPLTGIPEADLAEAVQEKLDKADTALQSESDPVFGASPAAGIQSSDITAWNAKYAKPATGIPASDIASGVIPDVGQFITKSVNDLANYYLKSETYTKDEVAALIGAIQQFHYEIVATLPATGESNILYLLGPTGTGADKYEEYVYANSTWTKIGDTSIDLSGYVTTTALNTALANYWPKADVVNITLSDLAITGDWADIENNPIPEPSASDNGKVLGVTDAQGALGWVQGGGGGSGSVTSVGLSVPTGLEVTGSPVTSSGTLAVSFQNGYSIPTDAKQSGWDAKYDKPSGGIPKTDLASGVQTSLEKADSALQSFTEADPIFTASPAHGITSSDITNWNGKQSAIADLADIRSGAAAGATAYQKPSGGIPETDLASAVQTSLGKADTAYQKPSTGIPASDIEAGVIPSVESLTTAEIDTIWNNAA